MAHDTHQQPAAAESHGLNPWQYIKIGVVLTAITVVELLISYSKDLGFDLGNLVIPLLLVLSAVKFAGVVAFYMHLRYDSLLFQRVFVGSFVLGAAVLLAVFALFRNDLTILH